MGQRLSETFHRPTHPKCRKMCWQSPLKSCQKACHAPTESVYDYCDWKVVVLVERCLGVNVSTQLAYLHNRHAWWEYHHAPHPWVSPPVSDRLYPAPGLAHGTNCCVHHVSCSSLQRLPSRICGIYREWKRGVSQPTGHRFKWSITYHAPWSCFAACDDCPDDAVPSGSWPVAASVPCLHRSEVDICVPGTVKRQKKRRTIDSIIVSN